MDTDLRNNLHNLRAWIAIRQEQDAKNPVRFSIDGHTDGVHMRVVLTCWRTDGTVHTRTVHTTVDELTNRPGNLLPRVGSALDFVQLSGRPVGTSLFLGGEK